MLPRRPAPRALLLPLVLALGLARLSLTSSPAASPAPPISSKEWPTLRGDAQRSGHLPYFPTGHLRLLWRQELWRELTGPRAEVIVADGLAFLGTYAGMVHAWDAATGVERWVFKTGGVIAHTAAFRDGVVYVGSANRRLHALEARTGRERWGFETEEGISVAPLIHRGRVYFGDRAGVFYAVDATSGREAWRMTTGDRILTSASASEEGDSVLFASEDMHVYCVAAADGKPRWKSRRLPGITLRDYAPVITGGLALITSSPVKDFHTILDEHQRLLVERTGFTGKDPRFIGGTKEDVAREQEVIVAHLRAHPDEQTFFAFRVTDGTEPWIAPILYTGGLHNPPTPPCVDRTTGEVFTQLRSAYTTWDGGGEVRPFTAFGRLRLDTGRVDLLGHAYPSKDPSRPPGDPDKPWGSFNYIGDETQTLAAAPGRLLSIHQGNIGQLDRSTGRLENRFGRRDSYGGFYGPATFGWENQGGVERARAAGQPYGLINEWHGPARALVSVAGGRVYFPVGSQVLCLEAKP